MKARRWLFVAAGTAGAIVLFLFLTLFLVPDREYKELAARLLEREGYTLRAARFGLAFPLGIKAVDLEIANDNGPLLKARKAAVRLRLLPLMTGKVTFGYRVDIGAGQISGDFSPRNGEIRIEASGIRLEDLPFFQTVTGAYVKGDTRLSGSLTGKEKGKEPGGELRLEIKAANVSGVKIGEIPLPDADYSTVQGMIRRKGNVFTLESFTLQGEGLYVRLKGDFPLATPPGNAPLNLTLELMPKPEFLEKQKFVFLLLAKYLVSPGSYQVPIRGTLAKPLIQ
jgi:type II secretion system protein N